MTDSILLIDDDVSRASRARDVLRAARLGRLPRAERRGRDRTFERALTDVVLVDLNLPGMDGLEVLERASRQGNGGHRPHRRRRRADRRSGDAVGRRELPHQAGRSRRSCRSTADRAVEKVRLRRVNRTLIGQSATAEGLDSLGTSALMREVARQVTLLAHGDRSAVLLQGESGTGKRWVARLLHDVSPRASAPFIEVACGAGDAAWLEAELFGRESGAAGDIVGRTSPGSARSGRRRHALPRRDRRPAAGDAGQAERNAGNAGDPARGRPREIPSTSASSPRRRARSPRSSTPVDFARISSGA